MQKTMHLFSASLVFLNMATLTKHCILRYESYFFSFCVFAFFFEKNIEKIAQKFNQHFLPQKTLNSRPGGPVLGPKIVPN